jgi:hypothetical protein
MNRSTKSEKSHFQGCIVCQYGHFIDELPLQGECRFNPPRTVFDKSSSNAERHFVNVKFDDWCGKLKIVETPQTSAQLKKMLPYLSSEQMYMEAKRALQDGNLNFSLKLFERLYQSDKLTNDVLNEISETILKSLNDKLDDDNLKSLFVEWQRRAADMGHPRACFYYALTLVQKRYFLLDEELSKKYLLRAAELGYGPAKKKVDSGDFLKLD